jgi:NAD(P)-dependent dehydrogenase (short-subunit alcohol dehydrogenase family)
VKPVAVVTGAANGIGAATARLLVEDGYDVVGLDVEQIQLQGVHGYHFDVTALDRIQPLVDEIERTHGPIKALANVAGAYQFVGLADLTPAEFRKPLAVFIEGPLFLSRAVGLRMAGRGSGRIVMVSSTAATQPMAGAIGYNAAKGGLDAAARSLAKELAPSNVLVNVLAPGAVRTRLSNDPETGVNEADTEEFAALIKYGHLPIGRTAEPEEIAGPLVFLLSERNTYLSGATVVVDGGMTASF